MQKDKTIIIYQIKVFYEYRAENSSSKNYSRTPSQLSSLYIYYSPAANSAWNDLELQRLLVCLSSYVSILIILFLLLRLKIVFELSLFATRSIFILFFLSSLFGCRMNGLSILSFYFLSGVRELVLVRKTHLLKTIWLI